MIQRKNTQTNFSKTRNDFETEIFASNLSSNEKLVALALKSCMNNTTGKCFPSDRKLMHMCSISKSTLKNCRITLEKVGYITRIVGCGRGKSTQYTLHPIQSDVNNRNKHEGNSTNLIQNYSPMASIDHADFPDVDFDKENTVPTFDDYAVLADENGEVIDLLDLPEEERTGYGEQLKTMPPEMRKGLLAGRLAYLRELQEVIPDFTEDACYPASSISTGSYDELNEIDQEAYEDF